MSENFGYFCSDHPVLSIVTNATLDDKKMKE